jgi:hypothetical protein
MNLFLFNRSSLFHANFGEGIEHVNGILQWVISRDPRQSDR